MKLRCIYSEVVINALRSTEVHFNLAQYATCPRLIRHIDAGGHRLPFHYDSMVSFCIRLVTINFFQTYLCALFNKTQREKYYDMYIKQWHYATITLRYFCHPNIALFCTVVHANTDSLVDNKHIC